MATGRPPARETWEVVNQRPGTRYRRPDLAGSDDRGGVSLAASAACRVTQDGLAATCKNQWAPEYQETTLSCLHVILEEEWEHHRYAVRDLDAIEADLQGT